MMIIQMASPTANCTCILPTLQEFFSFPISFDGKPVQTPLHTLTCMYRQHASFLCFPFHPQPTPLFAMVPSFPKAAVASRLTAASVNIRWPKSLTLRQLLNWCLSECCKPLLRWKPRPMSWKQRSSCCTIDGANPRSHEYELLRNASVSPALASNWFCLFACLSLCATWHAFGESWSHQGNSTVVAVMWWWSTFCYHVNPPAGDAFLGNIALTNNLLACTRWMPSHCRNFTQFKVEKKQQVGSFVFLYHLKYTPLTNAVWSGVFLDYRGTNRRLYTGRFSLQ